jgi:hypothetical protein
MSIELRRRRFGELALMDRGTESLADFVQEWYAKYAVPNLRLRRRFRKSLQTRSAPGRI